MADCTTSIGLGTMRLDTKNVENTCHNAKNPRRLSTDNDHDLRDGDQSQARHCAQARMVPPSKSVSKALKRIVPLLADWSETQ
jgi:hypothetical protein